MILPCSYVVRQELIRVGQVYWNGGFAVVSNGHYLGRTVAIKCLKMDEGDSDGIFKVPSIDLVYYYWSALNLHLAAMSRDRQLETLVPSEHLAFNRGFCVRKPELFPHPHRVDAQWERDAVCKIKSEGKPLAIGELAWCLFVFALFIDNL